ncbi:MAG: immunoglobulin domain-containing protein, partial [Limisphaerales bacterium]
VPITTNLTISGVQHTVTYYVTPDYMAIGSDSDYFLEPMTPLLAQRLDTLLGTIRPTRKMVDQIANRAVVHLQPNPIPPDPNMITVPYFNQHNTMVWTQRVVTLAAHPLGSLVDGDKKDVIISPKIYTNFANSSITRPVVIYGWHYPDGTFIQPEYNGHEETYADYSHGIRMVQNAILLDGTNSTITATLADPAVAAILSDETTFTGNTIPQPYYAVATVAPTIITHPYSRAVGPGANVQFSVLSVGDPPLTYTWKQNGSTISGATNSVLTINNAQPNNAGTYSVVVGNATGTATSWNATLTVNAQTHPILFSDDFDNNNSANWNLFWGADNGVPDYTVTWAYDYGATPYFYGGLSHLIPPSPHSTGSTKGVKFTVNTTNGANVGVNIYPKNKTFSGNFAVKFDMWINYPGSANGSGATGSTQFGIFGINHTGTRANWGAAGASSTDGFWFGCDGDGGATRDYRAYLGNLAGTQTELIGTSSGLTASNHAAAIYQTLFPTPPNETAGTPGKNWVSVEIDQTNNNVIVRMNGTIVAQRPNTSVFTNGTIMLGLMDVFPSLASPVAESYVIFDNVSVEDLSATLPNPAQLQSIAANTNSTISMSWLVTPSTTYLLQIKTNLNDALWATTGTYNSPSASLSLTDGPLVDPQRFYRLIFTNGSSP